MNPDDILWLSVEDVRYFHAEMLERGQLTGEHESRPIEAALDRVRNQALYGKIEYDILQIASAYAVAISRAHSFADGNKRTALMALLIFLDDNGFDLEEIDDNLLVQLMKSCAAGEIGEQELYDAIFDHLTHLT